MIEYLFKDLKTVDECIEKISSLFSKNRLNIYRDEAKDLFYIILKITIIDEDKYIPLKLNCVKQLQVCTIRYIYREITLFFKILDDGIKRRGDYSEVYVIIIMMEIDMKVILKMVKKKEKE